MNKLKQIIKEALYKSISYNEYRSLVEELANNGLSSGPELSESRIEFTKLNHKRMHRWDKTLKVSDDITSKMNGVSNKMIWLVITESWCGDAAHIIPPINKLAEANSNIHLRLVFRDENEALMNEFLTNGNKAIPMVIIIDENTKEVLSAYGPRPKTATKMVKDYKAQNGALTPEFKEELQRWYNKDKGQSTLIELFTLVG